MIQVNKKKNENINMLNCLIVCIEEGRTYTNYNKYEWKWTTYLPLLSGMSLLKKVTYWSIQGALFYFKNPHGEL